MDKMTDIRACSPAHEIEVQAALLRTPEFMAAFDAAKFAAQLDRIAARLRERYTTRVTFGPASIPIT